jgi:hypothetical protein
VRLLLTIACLAVKAVSLALDPSGEDATNNSVSGGIDSQSISKHSDIRLLLTIECLTVQDVSLTPNAEI